VLCFFPILIPPVFHDYPSSGASTVGPFDGTVPRDSFLLLTATTATTTTTTTATKKKKYCFIVSLEELKKIVENSEVAGLCPRTTRYEGGN
jgi:hypothetical protein